jgi:HSP20 family molecular chaperone IbpA/carbon monoxide dehydrogenase subunit G
MARVEQSIEIQAPPHTVYGQLVQFEHYPRFIEGVQQVRRTSASVLHWIFRTGGIHLEWDAEVTQQVPDRVIGLRAAGRPHGELKCELSEPPGSGAGRTLLRVFLDYDPAYEMIARHENAAAAIARHIEGDLARFKKLVETLPQQEETASSRPDDPRPAWFPNFMQVWEEPLHVMRRMSEEMDHMVDRFLSRSNFPKPNAASAATWTPAVEVAQTGDKLVISAELPGVAREDVHVEVKNDRITIEGERRQQRGNATQQMHRSERSYGHFYRVISLPEGAEPEAASAAMHDGVLEITVPVPNGGKRGKRIDIRAQ